MANSAFTQRYIVPWTATAGPAVTGVQNNGYFSTAAITISLPASSAVGDVLEASVVAGSVQFTQAAGQSIVFGSSTTTVGALGTLTSNAVGDSVSLRCITADTKWQVVSSIGTWTTA